MMRLAEPGLISANPWFETSRQYHMPCRLRLSVIFSTTREPSEQVDPNIAPSPVDVELRRTLNSFHFLK